jgi:hypothetical protein
MKGAGACSSGLNNEEQGAGNLKGKEPWEQRARGDRGVSKGIQGESEKGRGVGQEAVSLKVEGEWCSELKEKGVRSGRLELKGAEI